MAQGTSKNSRSGKKAETGPEIHLGTDPEMVLRELDTPVEIMTLHLTKRGGGHYRKRYMDAVAKDEKGFYLTQMGYVRGNLMDPFRVVESVRKWSGLTRDAALEFASVLAEGDRAKAALNANT